MALNDRSGLKELQAKGVLAMNSPEASEAFASELLLTMGAGNTVMKVRKMGVVPKTLFSLPTCTVGTIEEEDVEVIERLYEQGHLVYYVIPSSCGIGDVLMNMTSYLVVPKDIVGGVLGQYQHTMSMQEQEEVIRNHIEDALDAARRGYTYAYVLNRDGGFGEFGAIGVQSGGGVLIRTW